MAAAGGISGCGLLAGLGGYTDVATQASSSPDAGNPDLGEASDETAVEEPVEAAAPDDAAEESEPADVTTAPVDAEVDAAAVCKAQCSGCCDSTGMCHGGLSNDTCGSGAAACEDCTNSGMVCSSAGACAAPSQVDSGTKTCDPTKCTNQCPLLPLLEAPCCKSDHTCGCGAVLGVVACN